MLSRSVRHLVHLVLAGFSVQPVEQHARKVEADARVLPETARPFQQVIASETLNQHPHVFERALAPTQARSSKQTHPVLAAERWNLGSLERLELADRERVVPEPAHDLWHPNDERLDPEREQLEALKHKRVLRALQHTESLELDVVRSGGRRSVEAVDLCSDYDPFAGQRGREEPTELFVLVHSARFQASSVRGRGVLWLRTLELKLPASVDATLLVLVHAATSLDIALRAAHVQVDTPALLLCSECPLTGRVVRRLRGGPGEREREGAHKSV